MSNSHPRPEDREQQTHKEPTTKVGINWHQFLSHHHGVDPTQILDTKQMASTTWHTVEFSRNRRASSRAFPLSQEACSFFNLPGFLGASDHRGGRLFDRRRRNVPDPLSVSVRFLPSELMYPIRQAFRFRHCLGPENLPDPLSEPFFVLAAGGLYPIR